MTPKQQLFLHSLFVHSEAAKQAEAIRQIAAEIESGDLKCEPFKTETRFYDGTISVEMVVTFYNPRLPKGE